MEKQKKQKEERHRVRQKKQKKIIKNDSFMCVFSVCTISHCELHKRYKRHTHHKRRKQNKKRKRKMKHTETLHAYTPIHRFTDHRNSARQRQRMGSGRGEEEQDYIREVRVHCRRWICILFFRLFVLCVCVCFTRLFDSNVESVADIAVALTLCVDDYYCYLSRSWYMYSQQNNFEM